MAKDRFERHKQPWTGEEAGQLRTLAGKGQGLKQIAKALGRSEESTFRQEEQGQNCKETVGTLHFPATKAD